MTIRQVLDNGVRFRKERPSAGVFACGYDAKLAHLNRRSLERYELLEAVMTARRIDLRAANRRYRVHVGLHLKGA